MKKELVKKDAVVSNVASQQEGPPAYYQLGHGSAWSPSLAHCQPLVLHQKTHLLLLVLDCWLSGGTRTR